MEALFAPDRHERLLDRSWDAVAVRDAIERIVADADAAASPEGLWPIHPNDGPPGAPPFTDLYFGSAGIIWTLDYLASHGLAPDRRPFAADFQALLAHNRAFLAAPFMKGCSANGYLLAETGVRLVQWKTTGEGADALAVGIDANTADPALDLMWGAPGTMLAALFLSRATAEDRWRALFRSGAEALDRAFAFDEATGAFLWTQDLYGRKHRFLGAVHGFAANAYVLWAGRALLDPDAWTRWSGRIAATLSATARRGAAGANWPPMAGVSETSLVQFCHGAPGVVAALALLDEPIDDLLIGGGELIWAAGPLAKGANLCHGTGGNGYAFLKLFERTGDQKWLDRARAFAMHAIAQSEAEAAALGHRRYALWTGDLGLAVYLLDCLEARARFPTLDVF